MNFGELYESVMQEESDLEDDVPDYELEEGEEAFDELELSEEEDANMEYIGEAIVRQTVIRNGVRKVITKSDRPGYKIVRKGMTTKEVKLSGKESRTRTKSQFKGDIKRSATRNVSQKRRAVSIGKKGV
jgi:hypothetical protein